MSSDWFCEPCEKECGNEANLKGHLAGRAHRKKVESVIAEDAERLTAVKSALDDVQQKVKSRQSELDDIEEALSAGREEIEVNESTLKEQSEQVQKNATVLSAQKPELDALTAQIEPLRSEVAGLERRKSDLTVQKSELERQVSELTDNIQKAVAMRPELEQAARDEIIAQFIREEEARFLDDKRERLANQSDYQTGRISLDEMLRREHARVAKKTAQNQSVGELEQ